MPKPKQELQFTQSSQELSNFAAFLSNTPEDCSNTIEEWECVPKYFFTKNLVEKLRTPTGHADPYTWKYTHNDIRGRDKQCQVVIQPALILNKKENKYYAYFPGITEELIEEALKKILSDQNYSFHDSQKFETWVKFTLRMISKELKQRGCTRSLPEIKHAISVMNKCIISYSVDGHEIWSGAMLQDLITVGRDDYLEDTNLHHVARLPLFISNAINKQGYRQFNLEKYLSCKEQLARWIFKKLVNRFTHANHMNDYHFTYQSLKHSGLLQQSTERDNRKKVLSALKELQAINIISSFTHEEKKQGRSIDDVKYTVMASSEFIREQKAANKRNQTASLKHSNFTTKSVDNSL